MSTAEVSQASTDTDFVDAVRTHHRQLADELSQLVETITVAAADSDDIGAEAVALFGWCRTELLPHLKSADAALYSRGRERESTALLVRALTRSGDELRRLADDLDSNDDAIDTVALAAKVQATFTAHSATVDDLLLPAIADAGVDLADAVGGLPEIVGGSAKPKARAATPVSSDSDGSERAQITGVEEVDVRPLPHQGRHNIIFGKLQELTDTGELVIINDHDPKPLRYQTDALWPGVYEWIYLNEGPEEWRVKVICAK